MAYDPYAAASTSQSSPSFHPQDLYELDGLSSRPASLASRSHPPGLTPAHYSYGDLQPPSTPRGAPPTQRKRLTKPRPPSLSFAPRQLATARSFDGAGSVPNSAQTLFRASPSSASALYPSPGSLHRTPSSEFTSTHQSRLSSSYSLSQYDYSLPPSADDTVFLLDKKDGRSLSSALPPRKLGASLPGGGARLRPPRRKGLFENPPWVQLAIHAALCIIAWPMLFFLVPLVRASLFWTRAYVSVLCSTVGLAIGFSLLELVRRWSEAAGE